MSNVTNRRENLLQRGKTSPSQYCRQRENLAVEESLIHECNKKMLANGKLLAEEKPLAKRKDFAIAIIL